MSAQPTAPKAKPKKPARKRGVKPANPKAKARAKPKPKAPRKPRRAKPKTLRGKLIWRGVEIAIRYEAANTLSYFAHLELRVLAPEGAPIPVTESGYRSHYVYPVLVEAAGGLTAYVSKWLNDEACRPAYKRALDRWRQLELFG